MICQGTSDDHCCWLAGKVCEFLEEDTVPGRRWACGLYRELGSWDAVHTDHRYEPVKVFLEPHGFLCGDWPTPGVHCGTCGVTG